MLLAAYYYEYRHEMRVGGAVMPYSVSSLVDRWRNVVEHRRGKARGRADIFADYRIRIAHVVRDYGMFDRTEAPADSRASHAPSG